MFAGGGDRIKHVIYIIKENRTYDQILGDLAMRGQPVGNGDKSLAMYWRGGDANEHKLHCSLGCWITFSTRARCRVTACLVECGDRHGLPGADLGAELSWRAAEL